MTKDLTTPATSHPVTADHIPTINRLHTEATACAEEARAKANTATQMAIIIGLKLAALKAATPHGQWEKLFKGAEKRVGKSNGNHDCHLEFTRETARQYIAVATEIVNRRLTPEEAQALQHIAASATITPADSAFLEQITPAETLRQLYLSMGIVKPTRREALAMSDPPEEEDPAPEQDPPPPPSPTEIIRLRKEEARSFWFGTPAAGMVDKASVVSVMLLEIRKGEIEGRLRHLHRDDLLELADIFKQLLARTEKLAKSNA